MSALWHRPSEQPRRGSYILLDINGRLVGVEYIDAEGRGWRMSDTPSFASCRRWCYVADLLRLK